MHSSELQRLGLNPGDTVKVSQGRQRVLVVQADDRLPLGTARVPAGHPLTGQLGPMFGVLTVEPVMRGRA